jgi:DNA recombination protein RmuC
LQKMATKLQEIEQDRKGTDSALRTMIDRVARDQSTLQTETSRLVQALRAPSGRGQWGEMQLKRVLDMAGMQEGVDYERQASGQGVRPDVVIRLPGKQNLVIDAKTPMSAYLDACREGISEDERGLLMRKHAEQVRSHIKILGSKDYIAQFETPDFIVMFLPDENFHRAALDYDASLLEFGLDYKVILATPTTLIALLRAVAYGLRQEKLSQNAQSVLKLSDELYKRVGTFMSHFEKLQRGLNSAVGCFNLAAGSLERQVMSTVRKMQDLSGQQKITDTMPVPTIEQLARPLAMSVTEVVEPQEV